ncbi:hypothetical protein IPV08_23960 [Methylobacterium sp. SD274]|uniref:hypothetical protein n=1 Tax=Methylobacterium sp. SD274 TaxID=2782009 RepID=UPI001A971BBE|nr:hypothetical protein [Methylobacterium sp. SD274]MBO1023015.1 hypothetical protein [Methylobacterium sp. SD274]
MNEQSTGETEPQTLAVLDRLIETTTARLVHWIDRLQNLAVRGACTIEAMRVIVIVESALSRLIEERDLLSPSEPTP